MNKNMKPLGVQIDLEELEPFIEKYGYDTLIKAAQGKYVHEDEKGHLSLSDWILWRVFGYVKVWGADLLSEGKTKMKLIKYLEYMGVITLGVAVYWGSLYFWGVVFCG